MKLELELIPGVGSVTGKGMIPFFLLSPFLSIFRYFGRQEMKEGVVWYGTVRDFRLPGLCNGLPAPGSGFSEESGDMSGKSEREKKRQKAHHRPPS